MRYIGGFWSDERGAVAVDWVVMTAAAVGLSLASLVLVTTGVEALAGDIRDSLSMESWNLFGTGLQQVALFDFTGGNTEGWLGGTVMDMGGTLGEVLVLGHGESTSHLVAVPDGVGEAVMTFDLIAGDSLDSTDRWGYDTATITLNGETVAIAEAENSSLTFDIPQVDGTTVQATVTVEDVELGGNPGWTDAAAAVTISVDQPTEDIAFAVNSNSNQGINDEFWGVDNFDVGMSGGTGS